MPEYIEDNKDEFQKDNTAFEIKDVTQEPIKSDVDLIMCRDFMMHLRWDKVIDLILNFKKSKAKYLLCTNFSNYETHSDSYSIVANASDFGIEVENGDTEPQWGWKPTNLLLDPFNFPEPCYTFTEVHPDCGGRSMCLWKLEDIKL